MSAQQFSTTVLLTRPEGENESLQALLSPRFANILVSPMVRLSGLPVTPAMRKVAQDLDQIDKLFFVSKSAVRYTLPLLESFWPQWPVTTDWFAVGEGTAAELAAYDVNARYPVTAGSEGLLALPELQNLSGNKVVIVRGRGGRALLGDELENRGADLAYLETYQRDGIINSDLKALPERSIIVVTSVEILEAISVSLAEVLNDCSLVTASARIADAARSSGVTSVLNAGGASDQALYDAIVELARTA